MSRSGNVKVAVRLKPGEDNCISVDHDRRRVSVRNTDGAIHSFSVDQVFDGESSQSTIYKTTVAQLVTDFSTGRNCCVFAYGETGSGKTHTLFGPGVLKSNVRNYSNRYLDDETIEADEYSSLGSAGVSREPQVWNSRRKSSILSPPEQILARKGVKHESQNGNGLERASEHSKMTEVGGNIRPPLHRIVESSGIVPRMIKDIFDIFRRRRRRNSTTNIDQPKLSFSFVEIYDNRVLDLLDLDIVDYVDDDDFSLSVVSTPERGVYVEDAIDIECRNESDVSAAIEVALHTRELHFRKASARDNASHSVLIFTFERYSKSLGQRTSSNFFFVDLANSALVRKPPADASMKVVRECRSVKKSLGALRKSLRCLALNQPHPSHPNLDSNLTKLLQNSLVRGAGISVIVTAKSYAQNPVEALSAIRFGAYVAGYRTEDIDESFGNNADDSRWASSHSSKHASQRKESENQHKKIPAIKNGLTSSEIMDDDSRNISMASSDSFGELEKVLQVLKEIPAKYLGLPQKGGNNGNELSKISSLLDIAVEKIAEKLTLANKDLKNSGFNASLSSMEMQRQLEAVTNEIETMKYDGHLATQIQTDLRKAQEELKRLAIGMEDSSHNSSSITPKKSALESHLERNSADRGAGVHKPVELSPLRSGAAEPSRYLKSDIPSRRASYNDNEEINNLKAQLAELSKANEILKQEKTATEKELLAIREELKDLKSVNLGSEILEESDNCRNEVNNSLLSVNPIAAVEENTDDWDENRIEIGPSPVCVCLRLRPMTKLERNRRSRSCIEVHEGGREFTVDSPLDGEYDFCFDHVFDTDSTQEEVYDTVGAPIVDNLLGGVNCAVMVYGLTGSGKSHTLAGKLPEVLNNDQEDDSSDEESEKSVESQNQQDAGFSPRLVTDLFRGMKDSSSFVEYRITCTYVCIYLEKCFDLLDPRFDKTLIIRDSSNGIKIENAVEAFCFEEEDIIHLIRRGAACRKLIGNKLTMDPSRSHSILTMNIEQSHIRSGRVRRSYLQLVELAGFEVTSKAKGQSMQETKIIHKSFSALGNVIKSLTEGNHHAPYRESKLTSILKDALGGNCVTTIFITASPSSYLISETINSIRLGQRVRRVINKPRVNMDASIENYRVWLLRNEIRLSELSGFLKQLSGELRKANENDSAIQSMFSSEVWDSILAVLNEEESKINPTRKTLILQSEDFLNPDQRKWRSLTIELAKRVPSETLREIMAERDTAQSILSDIQSESVVLRRQNDLLVAENRKKDEELASVSTDNRKLTLQLTELDHYRQIAENRAKDAIIILRYLRTLCWKLRKDIELERPLDIADITNCFQGSPDLTGLVDLDSMMIENGFIYNKEIDVEKHETEYFDYLQKTGLLIDEEQVAAEDEVDELAFLDDGIGGTWSGENRWRRAQMKQGRVELNSDLPSMGGNSGGIDESKSSSNSETFFGLPLPWMTLKSQEQTGSTEGKSYFRGGVRYTRGEREVQRDLQNMADKCVELQMKLNHLRQFMDSLTNKSSSLKMNRLTQECLQLVKERDRVAHCGKASTWKLHELHVVNKLLAKQVGEAKTQIRFLEEGFQRLQETFRSTVQEGLETDQALRDRIKALQSIVDSLTGPAQPSEDEDDEGGTHAESDDDSMESGNPLLARIHIPLRGRTNPEPRVNHGRIDPSGPQSIPRCLLERYSGKRSKKRPSLFNHRASKFIRKSFKFGTALIGEHRKKLQNAYQKGKNVTPPLFLDDDVDDNDESLYTSNDYYDDDDYTT